MNHHPPPSQQSHQRLPSKATKCKYQSPPPSLPTSKPSPPTLSILFLFAMILLTTTTTTTTGHTIPSIPRAGSLTTTTSSSSNDETTTTATTEKPPKMPSLFNLPEEIPFDRYAACLAATEGLRRARDAELSSDKKQHKGLFPKQQQQETKEEEEEKRRRAEAKYIINSTKIIRALGLTVPQFNQLGREVMQNPELKERVMEQAYLYRITATLSMPRTPLLASETQLLKTHRRRRIQMFAHATMEMEELRTAQFDKLLQRLQVKQLPPQLNLCDPRVLPILSPKVRAVCEAFPLQAEEIVRKHGLNSEEFNEMLEECKRNKVLRWKVDRYLKQMESDRAKGIGD